MCIEVFRNCGRGRDAAAMGNKIPTFRITQCICPEGSRWNRNVRLFKTKCSTFLRKVES